MAKQIKKEESQDVKPCVVQVLTFKRETPGTFLFEFNGDQFADPVLKNLYLRKAAFKELGRVPAGIVVTITPILQ